ncbi:unnamed protein product [Echinostoma caproni]|uniref:Cystatin domain-containing protein n=1 Tax=Echinostoma caproni TaxID=27848 RepID=A0A183AWY1_9TREM|nr:unnamed protein product [Echinostoma caproni]
MPSHISIGISVLFLTVSQSLGDSTPGGYTDPRCVRPEEEAEFIPYLAPALKVSLPQFDIQHLRFVSVSTQVVAGTNYKFLVGLQYS